MPDVGKTTGIEPARTAATANDEGPSPVIVDLGKKKRKQVKKLRRGEGKLMDRVASILEELKSEGKVSSSAQPVIFIVKQSPRSRGLFSS